MKKIIRNKYNIISLLLSLFLILSALFYQPESKVFFVTTTPEQFASLIEKSAESKIDFEIIDLRTPQEYSQFFIPGAKNIDFYSPDFTEKLKALDRNKSYFIYCRSGNRSAKTLEQMKRLGFKKVYNLEGGIESWKEKNLPLLLRIK